ncbi:TVP38/TMEM64 family protein [Alteromonas sp. H39]|uniref:TVP38/TMEM64 family protein n=1 Tax=Alteromonas sp. H39 TaxID=3389876 RepID=UPI0039E1AB7A
MEVRDNTATGNGAIDYVRSFGAWAVVVFFILYVLLVTLSFPATILNVTSGILFSLWIAVGVSIVAALTGACLTFLIARFWLKDAIVKRLEKHENSHKMLELAEDSSWRLILLLRLTPFIPAVLKNYGFGITSVKFRQYLWSTLVGQFPLTTLYTYLGWLGGNAMLNSDSHPPTYQWAILGGGVIVSIIVSVVAYRQTHKKQQLHSSPAT